MKKILLVMICFSMILSTTVFASDMKSYLEYGSGDDDENTVYINSYDDYMNVLKEVDNQENSKQYYLSMVAEAITNYDKTIRQDVVKARVLEASPIEEEYVNDEYGYCRIRYQPLKVQVEEGEYKNDTFEVSYILTADTYGNIDVSPARNNQKINVVIKENGKTAYAYATTVDASVCRVNNLAILLLIAIFFVILYLGKKGLKMLIPAILLADIILLIFVPELLEGRSIVWLTVVSMLLYLIVNSALRVGTNSKMFASILTSVSVTLVAVVGTLIYGNIANFSGIILSSVNIIESFPKGTIDFYMLYVASVILITVIATSDISCKTISLYSENSVKDAKEKVKEYISDRLPTIMGVLIIVMIPKLLYIMVARYTFAEIISSEIFTSDIVRMLFILIAMALTVQVSEYASKLFVENNQKKK